MSSAVSSLPIFSANNPLAVAPAPSPEAPHANAFSQMLKQRQVAQSLPPATPTPTAPAAARAPAARPAAAPAPQAQKSTQPAAHPQAAGQAHAAGKSVEVSGDTEAADGSATDAASTDGAADAKGQDASLGSWLAGLNLPAPMAASTQAGGRLGRGMAQAADGPAGDKPAATGEAAGRGTRRLAGLDAAGGRAERSAAGSADAPAAKLLAEAAEQGSSFREVAAQTHASSDSLRTDAPPATGALLAAGLAASAPSAPTEAPTVVTLPTPVDAPEFTQALGVQVSLLAADGVQQAELHLNPAEMGPISVQIAIDGTQAQVDFGADMASTRHLIESGMPELASALHDAGFTLTGGGVSQQARQGSSDGGQGRGGEGGSRSRSIGGVEAADAADAAASRRSIARVSAGGVDLYA